MQIRNSVGNVVGTSRAIGRSKRSLLDSIYFSRLAKLTDASSVLPFSFRDSTPVCLVWLTRHVTERNSKRAPFVARTSCSDDLPSRWLLSSFSYFPNSEYSQSIVATREKHYDAYREIERERDVHFVEEKNWWNQRIEIMVTRTLRIRCRVFRL